MELFLNERSFEGQYFDHAQCGQAFKAYRLSLETLASAVEGCRVFYDASAFALRGVIAGQAFVASLNHIRDQSLSALIRDTMYNRFCIQDWRPQQQHSGEEFFWLADELVTDTTLAEVAERRLRNIGTVRVVLNFSGSSFAGLGALTILKGEPGEEVEEVEVLCFEDADAADRWAREQLEFPPYEADAVAPPQDQQTVLRDVGRFRRTSSRYDGRRVFREIDTGRYWYVDNSHFGQGAHLEVFEPNGQHLGTASLTGEFRPEGREAGRRLSP